MHQERTVAELILERHSTREFEPALEVPSEVLDNIVSCGLAAPSSKDAQPWRFHVVTDGKILASIADLVQAARGAESYVPHDPKTGMPHPQWKSTVVESAGVLRGCRAAVFVENRGLFSRGRRSLVEAALPALEGTIVGYGLEMLGLGAAVENMFLAAVGAGLGAAFMGDVVIAEPEIKAQLAIDGDLVGVLALGYPASAPRRRSRPVGDLRIHPLVSWYPEGDGADR